MCCVSCPCAILAFFVCCAVLGLVFVVCQVPGTGTVQFSTINRFAAGLPTQLQRRRQRRGGARGLQNVCQVWFRFLHCNTQQYNHSKMRLVWYGRVPNTVLGLGLVCMYIYSIRIRIYSMLVCIESILYSVLGQIPAW